MIYTYTSGSSDLSTHVADGGHTGTGDGVDSRSVVLHDGAGASLHGEDAGYLQDHVLGAGPAFQLTCEQKEIVFRLPITETFGFLCGI